MINYLYLENFKSIVKQKFFFSNINIICGPNNSGKSTVLAALNLIAQTLHDNPTDAPLVLNGKYDNLGTFHDLVHGHNPRSKIVIEFGIQKYSFRYEFKYRTQRREIELVTFVLKEGEKPLYSYIQKNDSYEVKFMGIPLENIKKLTSKRRPLVRGLIVIDPNVRNFRFSRPDTAQAKLNLGVEEDDDNQDALLATLSKIDRQMMFAFSQLRRTFERFDTLGAFRERPTRTYMFSGESPRQVGRTGASAIDILVSDSALRGNKSKELVHKISNWFIKTKMAKSIEINALTPRHYEICIADEAQGQHNLCDVGFGCSQVLPVLVSAYSFASKFEDDHKNSVGWNPILIIQEPEIHLHPNAQAELGTLFAESIRQTGQLFIETHSPYLILRIQSEVAKRTIPYGSVKTFYVERESGKSLFTEMNLESDGLFKTKWPHGFFPHRHEETLALAKLSSKSRSDK